MTWGSHRGRCGACRLALSHDPADRGRKSDGEEYTVALQLALLASRETESYVKSASKVDLAASVPTWPLRRVLRGSNVASPRGAGEVSRLLKILPNWSVQVHNKWS